MPKIKYIQTTVLVHFLVEIDIDCSTHGVVLCFGDLTFNFMTCILCVPVISYVGSTWSDLHLGLRWLHAKTLAGWICRGEEPLDSTAGEKGE